MVKLIGPHGSDDRDVVDRAAKMGQELAHRGAALPAFRKRVGRTEQLGVSFDEGKFLVLEQRVGTGLQVVLPELGLVIKELLLGRPPGHMQIDNSFGLGAK